MNDKEQLTTIFKFIKANGKGEIMKHKLAIIVALVLSSLASQADAEWVKGHYRNGSWVRSYWRGPRSSKSFSPTIFVVTPPPSETEIRDARLKRQKALWEQRKVMQAEYKASRLEKSKAEKYNRALREANRDPVHSQKMLRRAYLKKAEGLRVYMSKDLKYKVEASIVVSDGESTCTLLTKDGVEVTVEFTQLRTTDKMFLSGLGAYDIEFDVY